MTKNGSEAIENYPGTKMTGSVLHEIEKEILPVKFPKKTVQYLKESIASFLTLSVLGMGVWQYIKAGEEGRLPKIDNLDLQKGYEEIAPGVRILFGLEEIQEETEEAINKLIKETTFPKAVFASETTLSMIKTTKPHLTNEATPYSFSKKEEIVEKVEKEEDKEDKEVLEEAIVIRTGPDESKVALTFDDCWSDQAVREILTIAKKENIKVTFFPIGRVIKKYPELWQEVIAEGHEIANHTYTHPDLRKLSEESIKGEIQKAQEALDEALGYHYQMKYLRPPGGGFDQKVQKATTDSGIKYLAMWAVDNGAITTFKDCPEKILPWIESKTDGGEIVLSHVSANEIKILPEFIKYLKEKDLKMVTMSEFLIPPPPPAPQYYSPHNNYY
jgi:peptidoglycan-N-acetylglucosamine deacetylase